MWNRTVRYDNETANNFGGRQLKTPGYRRRKVKFRHRPGAVKEYKSTLISFTPEIRPTASWISSSR